MEPTTTISKPNEPWQEHPAPLNVGPALFIPTLYLCSGLPYTIVQLMSVVYYKNLGTSNELVGLVTSLYYLPWTIKGLWSPLVEFYGTRRTWILATQGAMVIWIAAISAGTTLPNAIELSLILFSVLAVLSATQDIAIDGYYLDVLSKDRQALFVGIRNTFYRIAMIAGQGGLIYLAGVKAKEMGVQGAWALSFAICVVAMLLLSVLHVFTLPDVPHEKKAAPANVDLREKFSGFIGVFKTYLDQPKILHVITYILIFRLGDALMLKMAQPFLLDPRDKGGLNMATETVGLIYGSVGVGFLLAGGIIGGWLVSRFGIKKCLLPAAFIQNSAILLYWWLAKAKPDDIISVAVCNSIEQFSYGLGVAAYTVFLLSTIKPEFKAAHYAITTGFMALGVMLPGMASGYMQTSLGYENFFLLSFLLSIPGIIIIYFLPMPEDQPGK